MKRTIAVLLITAFCGIHAQAQYSRLKDKARNLDDKINERHNAAENGTPPPGLPPKAGAAKPGAPAPAATPQPVVAPVKPGNQQQAATKLKADIAAARAQGEVTGEAKKQFAQDMKLAVMGSSQPSLATLAAFTESFLPAVAAKNVSPASDAKLVQNIVISLNCGGLSASRLTEIAGEMESALTKAGAPAPDAAKAAQGLTAIIAEVKNGAGK
jgi:hypothetical protein